MSAVVDLGEGRNLAGATQERPGPGEHWCISCWGSGVEFEIELGLCSMCSGLGVEKCEDTDCTEHHAEMDTAN